MKMVIRMNCVFINCNVGIVWCDCYREREMEELNRKTNTKLGSFSLVSLFMCLSVAGLQLWHLKTFFEKRKII